MKKLLIALVIIAGAIFLYAYRSSDNEAPIDAANGNQPSASQDPSNASFEFDDATISLKNGRVEREDEAGFSEEIILLDERASGDLNNDGKPDSALFLARSAGASGVFIHAAAYISGPVGYKGTNTVFLGDRVVPQSISISDGVTTITFLDRYEGEPFAAEPTVPTTIELIYRNGEFQKR